MTTSNSSKSNTKTTDVVVPSSNATTPPSLQTTISQAVGIVLPLETVVLILRAADEVAETMWGNIKRAAMLAAQNFVATYGVEAKVDHCLAVYEPIFMDIRDPNIKRDFTNVLWIYADPKAQVTIPKAVKKGEAPQTEIVDAIKALNSCSKKTVTNVAKQIREIHDAARAPGAGRPRNPVTPTPPLPNTGGTTLQPTAPGVIPGSTDPVATPPAPAIAPALGEHLLSMLPGGIPAAAPVVTPLQLPSANPAVATGTLQQGATSPTTTPATLPAPSTPKAAQPAKPSVTGKISKEEEDAAFYGELKVRLKNTGEAAKIHSMVEAEGYTVRRKANVTPAKADTPKDKTTILAEQILQATPEGAIGLAAKKAAEKAAAAK